jgi:hypothetical protein
LAGINREMQEERSKIDRRSVWNFKDGNGLEWSVLAFF